MVRTRFAPSPTGYLHIGGVRTALFNWLFARKHGGRFILRIDDTDRQRNLDEALTPILDGFRWLGIDWDEGAEVGGDHGPYYQSKKLERYQAAAQKLVDQGLAYHDYATPEELQQERQAAEVAKQRFLYSRRFLAETEDDRARFEAEGRQVVIRLKMPRQDACRFTDAVRGKMEFDWAREQDHVIQRTDGSCLYHLASVVDDYDMQITHVIRAEEHLSNTPRQLFIAQGLGYEPPQYAHLPFVAEPGSKSKLSKRKLDKYLKHSDFAKLNQHGDKVAQALGIETSAEVFNPVLVNFYQTMGFEPDAVVNYLLLLGWSLDDRSEMFSRDEMIQHFSLERIVKAAASFDPAKLMAFQERYMMALSVKERAQRALPYLERAGLTSAEETVTAIVRAAGDRLKVGGDILDYADFFTPDDELPYEDKAFNKRLRQPGDAANLLRAFRKELANSEDFDPESLENLMQRFVEAHEINLGQIIHALRVAVTGKSVGFGMFDILSILGRERCLARIDRALAKL